MDLKMDFFEGKLKRPIAVLDLETTGLDVDNDDIVQISIQRIEVDGTIKKFKSYVMTTKQSHHEALAVHGITIQKLISEKAPTFKEISTKIFDLLDGADLSGKNIKRFDLPILEKEFYDKASYQVDFTEYVIFDIEEIIRKVFSHSLTNAYELLTGEKRPDDAHDAHADTRDTIIVLSEMVNKFPAVGKTQDDWMEFIKPKDGREMVDYAGKFYKKDNVVYFNFGDSKDDAVETNVSLLRWMLEKPFFNSNTKKCIDKMLNKIFNPEN